MSASSPATSAGRKIPRSATPAAPRRVSGPANPPRSGSDPAAGPPARAPRAQIDASALAYADAAAPSRALPAPAPRRRATPAAARPRRLAYGGVAIASRVAGVALDVSSSRAMDRLVRSRIWIGIIAFALLGIVATQVSLLKLNTGISNAVQTASTLEQSNAGLRREVSRLSSPERIRPMAEAQGMVMPAPADVGYLRTRDTRAAAKRAAVSIQAPDRAVAGPAGTLTATTTVDGAAAPGADGAPASPAPSTVPPPQPAPVASTPPAQPAPAAGATPAPVGSPPPAAPAPAAQAGGAAAQATPSAVG